MEEELYQLLKRFFGRTSIKKRFAYFETQHCTQWEIWLHIELSMFLAELGAELILESAYTYHQKKTTKGSNRLDLAFRLQGTDSNRFIGLEIKQNLHKGSVVRAAIQDLKNAGKLLQTEWDLRAVFALVIFRPEAGQSSHEETLEALGARAIRIDNHYRALLFGWEGAPRDSEADLRLQYNEWCKSELP